MKEPRVSDAHPELHHYTDWKGLQGIVRTRSLWATHYQDLNDYSEMDQLKAHLIRGAGARLKRYLLETEKIDSVIARMIRKIKTTHFQIIRKIGGGYCRIPVRGHLQGL